MNLRHVFQVSLYSLTALSAVMLAYGEENPFPSGLTAVLSLAAYLLNERQAKIRLGLIWANGLGVVALGLAAFEFFGSRIDARLLAGAHFLVYLTWIVLFADKRVRQYWWLFALSLLQVAVGSVMTLSGWYGVFLLAYLLLALWTMAIFHLYQGSLRYGPASAEGELLEAGPLDDARSVPTAEPEQVSADGASTLAALFTPGLRATVNNAVQQDVPDQWITTRFVGGVLGMSVAGLGLGLALFLLVPRFWFGSSNVLTNRAGSSGRSLTGFSTEVRLGHMGKILESNERVLQVRVLDHDSDEPITLDEFASMYGLNEPLFRGSALEKYESGRWQSPGSEARLTNMRSHPRDDGLIRQEYIIDTQGSGVLFGMRPLTMGRLHDPYETLQYDPETQVISSKAEFRDPMEYRVYSARVTPVGGGRGLSGPFADMTLRGEWRREKYLDLPATGLSRLKSIANDWTNAVRNSREAAESLDLRLARALEARLRDSGEFQYSLNMAVSDPEIDPVEDFLFNRKAGHCEYFASALALMLRAVGVPSRLVTGFKGADYFASTGFYEVQQRHAHAWVEALVDDHWIVLDATPAARDESVRAIGSNAFWKSARNSLSSLWSTYVLNMSRSRQKESLYDPLAGSMSGGLQSARSFVDRIRSAINRLKDLFVSPESAISGWTIAVLLGVVILPFLAIRWLLRRRKLAFPRRHSQASQSRWSRFWRSVFGRWWGDSQGERFIVEFYERFVAAVSTRGLAPESFQTQREFARHVELNLNGSLSQTGLAGLPAHVAELYYRVRFGGETLDPSEGELLDRRLAEFEECLARENGAAVK